MTRVNVLAPAKLNLRLKLVGRRADGYHLLKMLNVTTSLVDEISISPAESPQPQLSVEGNFAADLKNLETENNLIIKAVKLFAKTFKVEPRISVHLRKNIPSGSGLGGGSSDAAATLRGLWELYYPNRLAPIDELRKLALNLGADVPYFITGGPAWVSGIGEEIEVANLEGLGFRDGLIVVPPVSVSTAAVYAAVRSGGAEFVPEVSVPEMSRTDFIENDLQPYAEAVAPKIRDTRLILESLNLGVVGMTGSGSGLFVLLRPEVMPDLSLVQNKIGDRAFLSPVKLQ